MKTILELACAAIALVASPIRATRAATFVGSSADITDFAGGSEVSTNGVLIDAVNLLNDNVAGVGVSTTINGVLFKGTQPGHFHEGAESFANASFVYNGGDGYADGRLWTSGGAYDTLADSQVYWISMSVGVINLVPAQLYELQVFMLDDRSGINKTFPLHFQQATFTGNNDQISNTDPNCHRLHFGHHHWRQRNDAGQWRNRHDQVQHRCRVQRYCLCVLRRSTRRSTECNCGRCQSRRA